MIQEGKLSPGAPVKENDLATFLNISRAPIREALQILTQDGLIVSEPQKGKTIRVLSAKEIIDGYALTAILEAEGIIMSLDNWTDEDNKDLLNILKKWKTKAKKPPISQTLPSLTNFCTICSYPAAPMNN